MNWTWSPVTAISSKGDSFVTSNVNGSYVHMYRCSCIDATRRQMEEWGMFPLKKKSAMKERKHTRYRKITHESEKTHSACRLRIPHAGYRMPHTACRTPHTVYRVRHTVYHMPHTEYRMPHTACRMPHTACRILHWYLKSQLIHEWMERESIMG